jgi:hypothetical protein
MTTDTIGDEGVTASAGGSLAGRGALSSAVVIGA